MPENDTLVQDKPKTKRRKKVIAPVTEFADKVGALPVEEKAELQKLLNSEPPKLQTVTVRCNRLTGKWEIYENGKVVESVQKLTLINVTFSAEYDKKLAVGCGTGGYVGYATGDRLPTSEPTSIPKQVVHLGFDPRGGCFWKKTQYGDWSAKMAGADYLVMKNDCSAVVIGPKGLKE